jgi:uncharacterized LabA/DUF88 family protein
MSMPTQGLFLSNHHMSKPEKPKSEIVCVSPPIRIAVMVDGGFFLKRYNALYNVTKRREPKTVVDALYALAMKHVGNENYLYRIFYYDCAPLEKRIHNPITGRCVNLAASPEATFKKQFMEELKRKRKVAIRLGELQTHNVWTFRPGVTKEIISGTKDRSNLVESDVLLDIKQKGIDMRIGIDITSLAIKRFVDKIVLISGDADFVPAAKMARREGIDFVLDSMFAPHINNALFEHIDGLQSYRLHQRPKKE